ncbi:MAG: rhodanese-like domain-containing protein [Gemmatimonadaceae bacterium]
MSRKLQNSLLAIASLTCIAHATADAQPQRPGAPRPSMVTSAKWLNDHLHDANLVVLQVSSKAQFDSAHIPGARQVALADISLSATESKLSLELPPTARLKAWAEANGITNNSHIVVVPNDSVLQSATRVFLTLAYMGAMDHTTLLDGGMLAWRADSHPTTADATPAAKTVTFDVRLRPDLIAAMNDVEKAINDKRVAIVDARLPRFYNGDGGGYPRAGHIPNALNIPLSTVSERGFLKDSTSLRKLFVDAGVTPGKAVVTYCHIGQQASLLWFVATMLGYDARLYDGSFQEWSGTERLPVIGKP